MSLDSTLLENVKQHGTKTTARCPACKESNKDESGEHLFIGADGKFGCIAFPGPDGAGHRKRIFELVGTKSEPAATLRTGGKVRATLDDAITDAMKWDKGLLGARETRRDFYTPDFLEVRFDFDDGREKQYRPFHRNGAGYKIGDPAGQLPLYHRSELKPTGRVYVVEGPKCADAVAALGLCSTTSSHGAKAPDAKLSDKKTLKHDWTPLAGHDVVILPDADEPGAAYARAVSEILQQLNPPAQVRIVNLPGLSGKQDVFDWLAAGHTAEELTALADAAPDCEPTKLAVELQGLANGATVEAGTVEPVLIGLDTIERQAIRWLWPGRFALGKLSLLAGDPGGGKSHLTLDVAARVSTGAQWPDGTGAAPLGQIILLSAEDDAADTIRPRLEAAGANLSRVKLLHAVCRTDANTGAKRDSGFCFEYDLPSLEAALKRLPDCRLIVIDPVSAYLGETDSHSNAEIRALFCPVAELAARYGVAVLTVTHLNKGQAGTKAIYRAMGSLAFIAQARTAFAVIRDEQDQTRRLFLPVKNNLAPDAGTGLAFSLTQWADDPAYCFIQWHPGAVDVSADEALNPQADNDRTEQNEIETWLREELSDGPVSAGELRKRAGLSGFNWRTVHRAKDRLGIAVVKSGMAGAWVWKLSDTYTLSPSANRVTFAQNEGFACHLHGTFEDDTKMTTPPKMTPEDDIQIPHIITKMTHTPEDDSKCVSIESNPADTVEGTL